jgi:putative membrane protein
MAFTAWMAGMWYLPRLMVYHSGTMVGTEASETFKVMERRLLRAIMTPAMLATFVAGAALVLAQEQYTQGWFHAKLLLVLLMAACHGLLASHVRQFAADGRPRPARWYRVFNEIPTLLFIGIVVLVVLKPF